MKIRSVYLLSIIIFLQGCKSQFFDYDFQKIKSKNSSFAQKKLLKDENLSLIEKRDLKKGLTYLPITSFTLTSEAIDYDSTKSIIYYINLNKTYPIQDVYTFKDGKYEGVKSFFKEVYFDGNGFAASYDTSKVFIDRHYNTIMYNSLEILTSQGYDFLFSVKYIRNSIWFIKDKKVYVLNLNDFKIYDPDEFINLHCSTSLIEKLASGDVSTYCN